MIVRTTWELQSIIQYCLFWKNVCIFKKTVWVRPYQKTLWSAKKFLRAGKALVKWSWLPYLIVPWYGYPVRHFGRLSKRRYHLSPSPQHWKTAGTYKTCAAISQTTTTRRLLPTVSNKIHRDLPRTQFWVKSDHFEILDLHPRRGLLLSIMY